DITNTGNVTLHDVALSDASVSESCGAFDGTLDPGETVQCTATHGLTQADIDAGQVVNTASVSAEGPLGDESSTADDATDSDSETVPVPQVVTISLDKEGTL